jgi:hypothetical protein
MYFNPLFWPSKREAIYATLHSFVTPSYFELTRCGSSDFYTPLLSCTGTCPVMWSPWNTFRPQTPFLSDPTMFTTNQRLILPRYLLPHLLFHRWTLFRTLMPDASTRTANLCALDHSQHLNLSSLHRPNTSHPSAPGMPVTVQSDEDGDSSEDLSFSPCGQN